MSPRTESEHYLEKLCRSSFLSLWSFPNVYRDQGPPKEICDLLVSFPPHVIIFSDKDVRFPTGISPELAWQRWFRAAVSDSARQLLGAARWLRKHPDRIFLDSKCTTPLPVALPSPNEMVLHRVVVAHGASEACNVRFGGSGSLMLHSEPATPSEEGLPLSGSKPFTIRHLGRGASFVHVFDDTTTEVLIKNLDTLDDFVNYLKKKEKFFGSKIVIAAGEEELLTVYKTTLNPEGEHDFVFPDEFASVLLAEGGWAEFERDPRRVAQVAADEISYFWDGLIEHFSKHFLAGTLDNVGSGKASDTERSLRFLARESRVRRRALSKSMRIVAEKASKTGFAVRVLGPARSTDPYYVLMVFASDPNEDRNQERKHRRAMLSAYCMVTRLVRPDATDIVGIAVDPPGTKPSSEDLLYFDARHWSAELEAQAREMQKELGILVDKKLMYWFENEYPVPPGPKASKGRDRNAPCGCGGGLKFKKCCGRPEGS